MFENLLAERGIPVYIPSNEDGAIQFNLAAKKVVFSTFHQSKGLERKVVIVFGCSKEYFTFFARDVDSSICPVISSLFLYMYRIKCIDVLGDHLCRSHSSNIEAHRDGGIQTRPTHAFLTPATPRHYA